MHRLGDVLQPGFAKIADGKLEPRSHLPVGVLRKTYGSRLGNALPAPRDVHAARHQVAIALLDGVAEMNADAKFDAPLRRQTGVALDHQVLNLDAATNSVDDTAKFHENSIAGSLHDASVVDSDCRIDQVASQGAQPRQRAVLVRSSQPAESDDVRREDRSKLSRLSHLCLRSCDAIPPHEKLLNLLLERASLLEWERQLLLARVDDEHRQQLGRLHLAGIGADGVAVAGQLGEALSSLVRRHRSVVDLTADRPLKHG